MSVIDEIKTYSGLQSSVHHFQMSLLVLLKQSVTGCHVVRTSISSTSLCVIAINSKNQIVQIVIFLLNDLPVEDDPLKVLTDINGLKDKIHDLYYSYKIDAFLRKERIDYQAKMVEFLLRTSN